MAQRPIINQPQGPDPTAHIAIVAMAVWVGVVGLLFWLLAADSAAGGLRHVVMLLVMLVPVGMGAAGLVVARNLRALRAEIDRLQLALDAAGAPQPAAPAIRPPVPPAMRPAPPRPAPKPASVARPLPAEQAALALGSLPDDDSPPLDRPDLIRALNFPDSEDDSDGFAALRRALRDRTARHLVQASQDVLTLLSQDGIYMDDLHTDAAQPDLWRRFAKGERSDAVGSVGAVREPAALAIVATRMREDTVFRDAVHHFLRRFDLILVGFEQDATDTDILALAETRTARAFMLLGRASRIFD